MREEAGEKSYACEAFTRPRNSDSPQWQAGEVSSVLWLLHSPESAQVSSPGRTPSTIHSCNIKGTGQGLACWSLIEYLPGLHKDLGSPQHWRGRKWKEATNISKQLWSGALLRPRTQHHKLGFQAERNFAMVHLSHYKLYHATNS